MEELLEHFQVYIVQENVRYLYFKWGGNTSRIGVVNHELATTYRHISHRGGQLSGVAGMLMFPLPEPEVSGTSDQDN